MKTKSNLIQAILLAAALLALPAVVQAQFTYTTNNGAITITGYSGPGGVVTVPSTIDGLPVKVIGDTAFGWNTNLTSVIIPNSVTNIEGAGDYYVTAFWGCFNLTNVTMGNSVQDIGDQAFYGCSKLASITIPSSVTSLGIDVFAGCASLTAITVASANPGYSSAAGVLFDKKQTTLIKCPEGKAGSYTIPASVTTIVGEGSGPPIGALFPQGAFEGCVKLTSIAIGSGVSDIEYAGFNSCSSLTNITVNVANPVFSSVSGVLFNKGQNALILYPQAKFGGYSIPNNVTNIEVGAFGGCTGLTSVTIGNRVTSIGDVFYGCINLTNVTIPNSVISLDNDAFAGCFSLSSVKIPNSVTNIGSSAFYCCGLRSITIGTNVVTIGDYAFADCESLTSITIPRSVTNIGSEAFWFCTSLTAITMDALNPMFSSVDGVLFDKTLTTLIQYPEGKANTAYAVPNGVITIADEAFDGCTRLAFVAMPEGVASIGYYAFANCVNLTNVVIPNSVTSISASAFSYSSGLTRIVIPNNLTNCEDAFSGSFLSNVTFASGATGIGDMEFEGCDYLTNIMIPDSVTSIGGGAFESCAGLTSVTIPDGVTSIGEYAFDSGPSLASVYFIGNAPTPSNDISVFSDDNNATVYYLPGTTGWGATFDGRPTLLWNPQAQTGDGSLGVRTNLFGFNITGTTNIPILVEAATNLNSPMWTPLITGTLTNGSIHFSDPAWTNYPGRFYRIRSP